MACLKLDVQPQIGRTIASGSGTFATSCKKVNSCEDSVFGTQHSEARPLAAAGATPNLRVVPDVNHGSAFPAAASGLLPPLYAMGSLLWAKLP
ncbi:hypothetical protein [Desulfosporosinus orientis]|uniref:hypothetical protein n=1 Tax=Desulfosporosinus orientis TaxID=1563 RepID=UPI0011D20EEA|nr:hypothetical protein [Desulfosporosinus orientis]